MKNHWSNFRGLNLKIGLAISLGLALVAFEWKTYEAPSIVTFTDDRFFAEEPPMLITYQTPPPPPKQMIAPVVVEVENTEKIEEQLSEVIFDADPSEPLNIDVDPEPEDEPVDDTDYNGTFIVVEESSSFDGGMKGFYEYVQNNLEYPRQARRMGVQGKVFLEFVIDKDGSITEVKVVRGIGAGCDEEASRILQKSPKWKPAKQRGRPVKQRMTIPINFRLN